VIGRLHDLAWVHDAGRIEGVLEGPHGVHCWAAVLGDQEVPLALAASSPPIAPCNVDEVAAAAEITKRTLYGHFRSKDALLAAVLESQHRLAFDAFQTFGKKLPGTPSEMIQALFDELSVWSAKPRWSGSGFTRLVMELADLPGHPARVIAKRHKAILEGHLANLLEQAGIASAKERAREVWLLSEGAMVLVLIHGDRSYIRTAAEAAQRLLAARTKRRA
jgi:AcrR family transcriptional regulator